MARTIKLTASMIRAYKSCPKLFQFQYIDMLKPVARSEALEVGSSYHDHVERILKREERPRSVDLPGIMADAFDRFIPWKDWNIADVEKEFQIHESYGLWMVGKIDAICADGTPIEHKTTRDAIDEKYVNKLAWDDQVSYYLLALSKKRNSPVTRTIYTACQKPTIRLKQNETEEQYLERMREWYDETKVRTFTVVRTAKELEDKEREVRDIAREIRNRRHWYRNPSHCSIVGCAFSSICLDYDPEMLMGFERKERMSEELCNF